MSGAQLQPVLRTTDLSVNYGGVRALRRARVEVHEGQLVGLIGPNGAGKTTFVDAISGFAHSRGAIALDGIPIESLAPHERARRGLARTWQSIELFDDLTVRGNLAVACQSPGLRRLVLPIFGGHHIEDRAIDDALELLDLVRLADEFPPSLSQGHRKLVGVARALAAKPRLLCLDEPAAGLDIDESQALGRRLQQVAKSGVATLLIDHDMDLVLTVSDYVYALDFGEVIAQGPPQEVREDPKMIEAYLGRSANNLKQA